MGAEALSHEPLSLAFSNFRMVQSRGHFKTYLDLTTQALVDEQLCHFSELDPYNRAKCLLTFRNSLIPNVADIKLWQEVDSNSLCRRGYCLRVLIQRYPLRLTDVLMRTEEEAVLVARDALLGYNALCKFVKHLFPLRAGMIVFDSQMQVKVWFHESMFNFQPQEGELPDSPAAFIKELFSIVESNSARQLPASLKSRIQSDFPLEAAILSLSTWLNARVPFQKQRQFLHHNRVDPTSSGISVYRTEQKKKVRPNQEFNSAA